MSSLSVIAVLWACASFWVLLVFLCEWADVEEFTKEISFTSKYPTIETYLLLAVFIAAGPFTLLFYYYLIMMEVSRENQ